AAAVGEGYRRRADFRPPGGSALRRRRTTVQPRPARVLLRALLSWLVFRSDPVGAVDHRHPHRHVATAIRLRDAQGLRRHARRLSALAQPQAIPISTVTAATISTARLVATAMTTRSSQSGCSAVS